MKKPHWSAHARKLVGGVLPVLVGMPHSQANNLGPASITEAVVHVAQQGSTTTTTRYPHLRVQGSLGDLLHHAAFSGFSDRMLPWDGRAYDEAMPLKEISQLVPYHSHVDSGVVIAALNRMVDEVNAGRTIFYDFYTETEQRANPSLKHTGLFFLRGKPGAPFAVIAPGGGFAYVGSVHEGFPYATEISQRGLNAFVIKYRAGQGGGVATQDLAAALAFIFKNARSLQVSTEGYSLWGSSAGARMAAAIGSWGSAAFGAQGLPKPSVVVMAYTGYGELATSEPSTFVAVGEHDGIALPSVMEARVAALRRLGTSVEYHKYPALGHGFGTGQGTSAQGWIGEAVEFWQKEIRKAHE